MNRRPVIISAGEVLWDLFPEGPRFGGAPANFACHAARLGGAVSLISAVGRDERGAGAVRILQSFGVDTRLIQSTADAPTGSVRVTLDPAGKPAFDITAGAAWDNLFPDPAGEAAIAGAGAFYFGTLGLRSAASRETIHRLLDLAKACGLLRVLDVNLRRPFYDAARIRDSIARASVLKLSDDELPEVAAACGIALEARPENTLRRLRETCGLDLIAMTRGADGALLVAAAETVHQPGIPTVVRDTVGAGDSFTAALVTGLLRGDALADIARTACETASAVCAQDGAVPLAAPGPAILHPLPSSPSHETVPAPVCC